MSDKKSIIPYGKQSISDEDIQAVCEVLCSEWITQGPVIERFEEKLAHIQESRYATVVSSGTAALHLVALALDWKTEDVILTTPVTFLASANCILYSGATPDFVDIDPVQYTIDPNKLEEKIKNLRNQGKKVKAVIAVDFAGHPCYWRDLRKIADRYEVQLVDDASHALGAFYAGKPIGSCNYADVSVFSFHPVKQITTGEGGAIVSSDKDFDQKVKRLRCHGMTKDQELLEQNEGPWYYEMIELGFNYRITDFQCVLGLGQLDRLDQFITKRKHIATTYNRFFEGNELLITPKEVGNITHSWHLYPLQIRFENVSISKSNFFREMREKKIGLQVHYIPVHLQPYYKKKFGFQENDFPISEKFYHREVSLPMFPALQEDEMNYVIEQIQKFII